MTESPTSNPGSSSDGLLTSYESEKLKDAIHYFHIKFKNSRGWGEIAHRRVLVDTIAPESFKVAVYDNGDPTNPTPEVRFKTTDAVSGISYYEIKIDGNGKEKMAGVVFETNPYTPPPLPAGRHSVVVEAFDGADNSTAATTEFIIKPIATPQITEYPSEIQIGETLTVKGTFIPEAIVRVYAQKEGEEADKKEIKASKEGKWIYVHERALERGVYRVWVEGIDARGAQSYPSDKINIAVKLPALFKVGKLAVDYLSIMVSLLAIIVLIIVAVFFGWYRMVEWRKKLRREVREAEESVQKAFDALYEDMRDNLEALENVKTERELSHEEKKLLKSMKGALDVAERYIGKEMKDVEKELE
jgi:Sec-independent protein translocase protein TatA